MKFQITKEIEDKIIINFISIIEKLQLHAQETISTITQQSDKIDFRPIIMVAIVIMKRCLECSNSVKILSLIENERDAAILILNLIELRHDILYIDQDHSHANEWLNHDKEYRKPWKVSYLRKKLYKGSELEAEKNNYKRFSMIKHGNPVGGFTSFPIEITERNLVLRDTTKNKNILPVYLFSCGTEIYRINDALINISKEYGYDLKTDREKLDMLKKKLDKIHQSYINNQIHKLKNNIVIPDLCKKCGAIPEDVIEITCLLKQANKKDNKKFNCDKYKPL